jgi:hypothetical protein
VPTEVHIERLVLRGAAATSRQTVASAVTAALAGRIFASAAERERVVKHLTAAIVARLEQARSARTGP